ncbi:methyltransferase domain-containing protein [Candidatus Pacearchaeota archaeon]|nr:methyltransferase domain-containing protein [Candidatus Pacearchaeota archaeon]
MNEQKFKESEAKFIAQYILNGLNINIKNKDINIKKSKGFIEIIKNIEKIENTWKYKPKDNSHTFGRKHNDETIGLWSVPPMTAKVLSYLVLYSNSKNILEIGTSAGYSTLHLAIASKVNKGHVFTIELLDKKIELAKENFSKSGISKDITLIEDEASKVLNNWKYGKVDLVFLDADKENYSKYLDQLLPIMNIGGLIIADNINDYGHMMGDFLQRVTGTHLPKSRCDIRVKSFYVAQLDNGLMIIKKISE